MSKAQKGAKNPPSQVEGNAGTTRKMPKRGGADPYIRTLFGIAAIVIVGALLTVIFAYISGVIDVNPDRASTIEEFTVASSRAYADSERTAGALSQLAMSLIANRNFIEAQAVITEAYALNSPDEERNQGPLFASAHLALAQGDTELARERFEEAMARLREDFDRVYESDMEPNWAQAFGMHPNYYESAIALSFLARDEGNFDREIEMLDIAAEGMPTNADVFVFRGQAKLHIGDNAGAIEDFNNVLRFIPDDADALAGLEKAGGSVNDD
jgi:tetratricopeptide (TPR) repeat protein